MNFVRVAGPADAAEPLAERLTRELQAGGLVLWFVSGGSNISISVKAMDLIPDELTPRLAIYLTDERFGPVGHPDSNFQQLMDAGFDPKKAAVVPVLVPGVALEETRKRYSDAVATALERASVAIGQFGIGADGHIAGLLPETEALTSKKLVAAYETETFTRITITPLVIARLNLSYACAFGDTKLATLHELQSKKLSVSKQPAVLLKKIKESYVYNDQIGDSL